MPEVGFRYISYNKDMPEETARDPEERRRFKRTNPEEIKEKQAKERQRRKSERAAVEKRQEEQRPAKKKSAEELPSATKPKEKVEVSYKDAKIAAEILADLRDEKKVVMTDAQFESFKQILLDGGYDLKQISRMSRPEIVVASQKVLQAAAIDGSGEQADLLVAELIKKAQSQGEELLSVDKVSEDLSSPPVHGGAMEAEGAEERGMVAPKDIDLRDAKEVIARLKIMTRIGMASGIDDYKQDERYIDAMTTLTSYRAGFTRAIEGGHFLQVYDFAKAIDDAVYTAENYEPPLPDRRAAITILNDFLADWKSFDDRRDEMDKRYQRIYGRMDDSTRQILLSELESTMSSRLQGVISGWYTADNVRNEIFGGRFDEYDREGNRTGERVSTGALGRVSRTAEESLGGDVIGLSEWRATKEVYGAEKRLTIEFLTRPPSQWEEVPERITNIYNFIERTDFTVEQLQGYIQKALAMIESVQTEDETGRRQLNELNKELKAFQAFHTLRVTLEKTSMDPEQIQNVFKSSFDDETWQYFINRFGHDSRIRTFLNKDGVQVNLLDEAWMIYMKQFQGERIDMNIVEALTRIKDLTNFGEEEFKDVVDFLNRGREEAKRVSIDHNKVEELRKRLLKLGAAEAWKKGKDSMKRVVDEWYRNDTLLGAYGKGKNEGGEDEDLLNKRRGEMRAKLAQVLRDKGLNVEEGETDIDKLMADLEKRGFLEAVDANAFNLMRVFAWSDFDGVRIYGVNFKTKKVAKYPQAYVFNGRTEMFGGRMIDHYMDFLVDEERGRSYEEDEVNGTFRDFLPGEHHNMLPQNRTIVRMARFFYNENQLKEIDRRANLIMREKNFLPAEKYRAQMEQEINNDPNKPERDPYFTGFIGWVRSAVIGEIIDSGEFGTLDFSKTSFSKIAGEKDFSQYFMIDLYDDRKASANFYGRKNLQEYLKNPTNENFFRIHDGKEVFYSGRNVRIWPATMIFTRAHWEISHKLWKRLGLKEQNMQSGGFETVIEGIVENGAMRKEQGDLLKNELLGMKAGFLKNVPGSGILGTLPFRRIRQGADFVRIGLWETAKSPGTWLGGLFDLFKRIFGYGVGGLGGK